MTLAFNNLCVVDYVQRLDASSIVMLTYRDSKWIYCYQCSFWQSNLEFQGNDSHVCFGRILYLVLQYFSRTYIPRAPLVFMCSLTYGKWWHIFSVFHRTWVLKVECINMLLFKCKIHFKNLRVGTVLFLSFTSNLSLTKNLSLVFFFIICFLYSWCKILLSWNLFDVTLMFTYFTS